MSRLRRWDDEERHVQGRRVPGIWVDCSWKYVNCTEDGMSGGGMPCAAGEAWCRGCVSSTLRCGVLPPNSTSPCSQLPLLVPAPTDNPHTRCSNLLVYALAPTCAGESRGQGGVGVLTGRRCEQGSTRLAHPPPRNRYDGDAAHKRIAIVGRARAACMCVGWRHDAPGGRLRRRGAQRARGGR
jgi:hypothetical protein